PPPGYYGGPTGGPMFPSTEKNSLGVWALVLGILGLVCCGICSAIPAVLVGNKSKEVAVRGLANNGGRGRAGVVRGSIGIVLSARVIICVLCLGGLGVLSETGQF